MRPTRGRFRILAIEIAVLAAAMLFPARARAQNLRSSAGAAGLPPPTKGVEEAGQRPYWGGGPTRSFLSSIIELGPFYARTGMAVGYGKPHWQWVGLEGQTSVSTSGGTEYAGVRASSPWIDARGGARYSFPVTQYFLEKRETYSQRQIEFLDGPRSHYLALEAEVSGAAPLFGGSVFAVATGYYIRGVPAAYNIFEDSLHVVMAPPYLWRGRLGYVYGFGLNKALRLGAAVELIGNPGRSTYVVRTGPVLAVALTHHLEASATVLGVVTSPDALRLRGAEIGQLGFRYKWATGDLYPEFP